MPQSPTFTPPSRSWRAKFADAFRGLREGSRGQTSFVVHLLFAAAVVTAAAVFRMGWIEWALLVVCIALVLTAEMFNSALESMARAITSERNPHIEKGLNVASAAVLLASLGAAAAGVMLFAHRLGEPAGWW
ncbi:MAG: diacylglycerol kinase [Thermoguttaceae bacterium]|jgi:diacylglycerol kinase